MIKRLMAVGVAAVAVVIAGPATVNAQTALEMSSYCKTTAEADRVRLGRMRFIQKREDGICVGFFWAIIGAMGAKSGPDKDAKPLLHICRPDKATVIQMVKVFRKYVQEKPAEGHKNAFLIATKALTAAFPCEKLEK